MCILYNQRDATYTILFIIISALHVSGGLSAHHQELIKLYVQPCTAHAKQSQLTHDSGKKQTKLDKYPMLCIQFSAPDDGRRNRLKHLKYL
jgi:hypothetical protein